MNIIERQTELSKSLFEINTNTMQELASLTRESVEKYLDTNREFGERLPEVKNVSDFMALQREYGETLWNNTRTAVESQNDIVRSAFEETTEAFRSAFSAEAAEEAPAPKPAAKPKAKAKARKATTRAAA